MIRIISLRTDYGLPRVQAARSVKDHSRGGVYQDSYMLSFRCNYDNRRRIVLQGAR